jgi:hypothetical protein
MSAKIAWHGYQNKGAHTTTIGRANLVNSSWEARINTRLIRPFISARPTSLLEVQVAIIAGRKVHRGRL